MFGIDGSAACNVAASGSATRSHSLVRDALAKSQKAAKIETVDEELGLKDATRTVNLCRIAGNSHADTVEAFVRVPC